MWKQLDCGCVLNQPFPDGPLVVEQCNEHGGQRRYFSQQRLREMADRKERLMDMQLRLLEHQVEIIRTVQEAMATTPDE